MTDEKRRHERYPIEVACEVELDGDTLAATTRNLSKGGAMIEVERKVTEGQVLEVAFFLTQDGIEDPDEEPLETQARVQWASEADTAGHFVAGLQLVDATEEQQGQLERFLAALAE